MFLNHLRMQLDGGVGAEQVVTDPAATTEPTPEKTPAEGLSKEDKQALEQREAFFQGKYQDLTTFVKEKHPGSIEEFKRDEPKTPANPAVTPTPGSVQATEVKQVTEQTGFGVNGTEVYDPYNMHHVRQLSAPLSEQRMTEIVTKAVQQHDASRTQRDLSSQIRHENKEVDDQIDSLREQVPKEIQTAVQKKVDMYGIDRTKPGGAYRYLSALTDVLSNVWRDEGLREHATKVAVTAAETAKGVLAMEQPAGSPGTVDKGEAKDPQLNKLNETLKRGGGLSSDKIMGTSE